MSFQDPPRRQRPSRYPALAPHEDGYPSYQDTYRNGNGHRRFTGPAGAPRQRPPWDEPSRQNARDAGARQAPGNPGTQRPLRSLWDTGAQPSVRTTGAQPSVRSTGAQRAVPDTAAPQTGRELPHRRPGAPAVARAASGGGHARRHDARGGARRAGRGLLPGGAAGFLAAAVALGTANLTAAFVRPQASPIIAVGGAFIDRTPSALKNFAVEKFGENDKNMLLLGMYVTIALIAIAIGMLAWRRVAIGVAGIGLFGLFGAFVAITRPESHVTDAIPSIIGGIAGIAAIVWLVQAGMPRTRPAWTRGR